MTLAKNATLTGVNGGTLTLAGGLTLSSSGRCMTFGLPISGTTISATSPLINVTGSLTLNSGISVTPYALDTVGHTLTTGTYDLLQSTTALTFTQFSDFSLGATAPTGYAWQLSNGTTTNSLDLIVTPVSVYAWSGTTSNAWETASNWNPALVPSSGATLTFGNSGANGTVVLALSHTVGPLTFNSNVSTTIGTGNNSTLTLDTGSVTDSVSVSGTHTINVPIALNSNVAVSGAAGSQLTIGGIIGDGTASHGISLSGSGGLVLGASNTYSGGTAISSGTLQVGNVSALGTGPLTLSGGVLDLQTQNLAVGTLSGAGGTILSNAPGSTPTLTVNLASGSNTYGGSLANGSGTLALATSGSGILNLSASNTYTGGTTIGGGTLQVGNASALGPAGGPLALSGGALDVQGYNLTVGTLSGGGGTILTSSAGSTPHLHGQYALRFEHLRRQPGKRRRHAGPGQGGQRHADPGRKQQLLRQRLGHRRHARGREQQCLRHDQHGHFNDQGRLPGPDGRNHDSSRSEFHLER